MYHNNDCTYDLLIHLLLEVPPELNKKRGMFTKNM